MALNDLNGVSTFPVAKANLHKLLKVGYANKEPKVAFDYGDPGIAKLELEHVFMAGSDEDDIGWAPVGRLAQEETYGILLYVHTARPGKTQQEATERAHVLLGIAQQVIRPLQRTCGTTVAAGMVKILLIERKVDELVLDEGYGCFIQGSIVCTARN